MTGYSVVGKGLPRIDGPEKELSNQLMVSVTTELLTIKKLPF